MHIQDGGMLICCCLPIAHTFMYLDIDFDIDFPTEDNGKERERDFISIIFETKFGMSHMLILFHGHLLKPC